MRIRTYLILSYIALILLLSLGMWAVDEFIVNRMTARNVIFAEEGVMRLTTANYQLSKQILTTFGENIVEDKAEDVKRELVYIFRESFKGKQTISHDQLRRHPLIRKLATQEIFSPYGPAGHVDLIDNRGEAILHPYKNVEGKNLSQWKDEFPEMWKLVSQSFTDPLVKGYYTFVDGENRPRERFMVMRQVPQTPFIVVAVVNIDEFFQPVQDKIKQASQEIVAQARQSIVDHHRKMDNQVKMVGGIGGLVFILLALLFGIYFASVISHPIVRLRRGVEEVGEGNFAITVPARGTKEIIHLAHSFNRMGERLTEYIAKRDFIRDTFGRYVTMEVVKKLLEDKDALELGGETREVSILMSDIRGFTALTAEMAPEQVIIFLNRYLGKMIEILTDYHAVIDEIVGDGILAFFGAPEPLEDHPVRAVACALQMQTAMDEINFLNEADGLPRLEMGVAVNTGAVVVGNIGSAQRAKYSVVGAHVNFTSRIEASAVGGQVLISSDTYQKVKDSIEVGETLKVGMKGVPKPATLYEVVAIFDPYNLRLKGRSQNLIPLPEPMEANLYRLSDKIVTGPTHPARITHLCETAAILDHEGHLYEWEDVRLHLLDADHVEIQGRIYGKVVSVKPAGDGFHQAQIRFTSVSPEMSKIIRQAVDLG